MSKEEENKFKGHPLFGKSKPSPLAVIPGTQIWAGVVTWTPELATAAIKNFNEHNRSLSAERVDKHASIFRRGEYMTTFEGVAFDDRDQILDGQGRLAGLAKADMIANMITFFNCPNEHFAVVNTGKSRTIADAFSIDGEKCTTILSSALIWLYNYDNGLSLTKSSPGHGTLAMLLEENPALREYVQTMRRLCAKAYVANGYRLPIGAMAGIYYAAGRRSDEKAGMALEFFRQFVTKVNMEEGCPAHVLHKKMSQAVRTMRGNPSTPIFSAWCIKALTAHLQGTRIQIIKFGEDEAFPYGAL